MLLNYKFNNFCSFWSDCEFSTEAAQGKVLRRYPDNFVSTGSDVDVLKTIVIVGENAGGKSNFIRSLNFLKSLFAENNKVRSLEAYINFASQSAEDTPQQTFELEILPTEHDIYRYRLVLDAQGIVSEWLSHRSKRKGKETVELDFNREGNSDGQHLVGRAIAAYPMLRKQREQSIGLWVTKLALLGDEHANRVVDWMNHRLQIAEPGAQHPNVIQQQSDLAILRDPKYLEILRMVDDSICGMELDPENPYRKTVLIRKDAGGATYKRELQMDSSGVREFFAWAVQLYRVVYENAVVFADEMDRVLNPMLSDRVIAFINGKVHHGQFIFTTHNVLQLNLVTYMKEQIYFITKYRHSLKSDLYSLADFPKVRYTTPKIYEFYQKGLFHLQERM